MAAAPEEQAPSAAAAAAPQAPPAPPAPPPPQADEISSSKAQASGSSDSVAQGLTSDWKWVNQKELQTLVTRAADGSGVELAAKSSSSAAEGESAGTFVRVVTENGAEFEGNLSNAGGSRQIAHILLTPGASPPPLPDDSSKGKWEAGKKKRIVSDEEFDDVDLEKGLGTSGTGVDKNAVQKGTVLEYEGAEETVCRVCHFNLGPSKESLMDLGCSCKRDLSHAHRECAETWFRVRGNREVGHRSCRIGDRYFKVVEKRRAARATLRDYLAKQTLELVMYFCDYFLVFSSSRMGGAVFCRKENSWEETTMCEAYWSASVIVDVDSLVSGCPEGHLFDVPFTL
ncbi:hypothetical protein AXG93_2958s1240 [Marchantia polymorpha subsp. ruderalis]|uniref:RING-CH-type domain-containing protein n=1 Tax=Marchantia polymorpha subsp. ruderalis TaxID=1480154 RepID=A0A176VFM1_MARPO|nr:hypothetical protein AXG93_2958s1240 [Marchantia polymorpha subsp. ruderalis]